MVGVLGGKVLGVKVFLFALLFGICGLSAVLHAESTRISAATLIPILKIMGVLGLLGDLIIQSPYLSTGFRQFSFVTSALFVDTRVVCRGCRTRVLPPFGTL